MNKSRCTREIVEGSELDNKQQHTLEYCVTHCYLYRIDGNSAETMKNCKEDIHAET